METPANNAMPSSAIGARPTTARPAPSSNANAISAPFSVLEDLRESMSQQDNLLSQLVNKLSPHLDAPAETVAPTSVPSGPFALMTDQLLLLNRHIKQSNVTLAAVLDDIS